MCGIAGVVALGQKSDMEEMLHIAEGVQLHRGPDMQGKRVYQEMAWQVGFAHQRLSILDLSMAGQQPMETKRSTLIFNGEIYNYLELREKLQQEGCGFRTNSDTEVVLFALEHWGPEKAFSQFNGMWSLAWLDHSRHQLIFSRDRMGVKPLYYYLTQQGLFFASELKTILAMAGQKFSLNLQKVGESLLQYMLDTSEDTFFTGIRKVVPGIVVRLDLSLEQLVWHEHRYWDITMLGTNNDSLISNIDKARALFEDAVHLRLRSDVPVGVLLSGGIDSSAIASMMNHIQGSSANLHLLSAVSRDSHYDESPFIDIMGSFLQRDVYKVMLDFEPQRAFHYLEEVCWYNDAPVGSFSNVAHYLLMKKAKELGISVILSGQGADELLCGYKKYLGFYVQQLMRNRNYVQAAKVLYGFWHQGTILCQFTRQEAKRYLPGFLRSNACDIRGEALQDFQPLQMGLLAGMNVPVRQLADVQKFSVPILTHYEDRMSMACSREVRVPFLDYRLVEFFLSLPVEQKLYDGWTKYIFRQAMADYLPAEIVWRKDKQGFVNPENEWLKGYLKPGVLDYFAPDSMIFKYQLIQRKSLLKAYKVYCQESSGKGIVDRRDIFNALSLEIWLRRFEQYIA